MRYFFLLTIALFLYAADLNETIIKETNTTFYENIVKELNTSSPDYTLQKTLISKIEGFLSKTPKLPNQKDFDVTKESKFIDAFFTVNQYLLKAKKLEQENSQLKEQLDDIYEDIKESESNSSDYLTLNLEYAYYAKQKDFNAKIISAINNNYEKWLDTLLNNLPKVKFHYDQKRYQNLLKQIEALNTKIKKYEIEKERYKILGSKRRVETAQKKIEFYTNKKELLVKEAIKERLKEFFAALQKKDEKAIKIAHQIVAFAQKESNDPQLASTLEQLLGMAVEKKLGSRYVFFLQLKQQVLDFLNNNSFLGIPLYKFAEGLGVFLLFLLFRRLFALVVLRSLHHLTKATKTSLDDKLIALLEGPLKFTFIIIGLYFALDVAGVESAVADKIIKSLIIFVIFWLMFNLVNILDETIYKFARKFGKELYREIGAFFIKTLKIFIFAIGLVSILQEWDINVSAFIASLGLGGLAFALAAKDTAANLFGGLSILADRALKIDDWIKVGSVEGTVEEIGLRTTKVRTFEKSLVTVPNQYIANNPIENFSRRNIRRIKMRIGLVYSTTHEQMQAILNDIRNMLQSHPGIAKNATLLVNFDEFGSSELSIFIYCFTNTADWAKYLAIKEDVNLKIMEIVQKHGSDFAFPSESLYIEKLPEEIWKK